MYNRETDGGYGVVVAQGFVEPLVRERNPLATHVVLGIKFLMLYSYVELRNMKKKKVLLLYLTKWSGHASAAGALRVALERDYPDIQCEESDFVSDAFPGLTTMFKKASVGVMKYLPSVWNFLYDNEDIEEATEDVRELFDMMYGGWLQKKVELSGADSIVCTQALPCEILAYQKLCGKLNVPLIAVPTDFRVHAYWLHPAIDRYLVPSEEASRDLVARGIAQDRIIVTGIPVHPDFSRAGSKESARVALGLDQDIFTVLCVGGSYGFGAFRKLLRRIADSRLNIQIVMVTGKNEALYKKLSDECGAQKQFKILGYVKSMADIMDAVDIVLGKPGGLTSSESFAKGLPMIVFNPLPGQEERNTEYIIWHGAGIKANDVHDAYELLMRLARDKKEFDSLRAGARAIGRKDSAKKGAEEIVRMLR